jgi:hypothetical protein
MSWSAGFAKPIRKAEASAAIDALTPGGQTAGPVIEQCDAAKAVAKILLASVPGSHVTVALSGHANGIGWQKKENTANDCINVSVTQICEEDLKNWAMPPTEVR